MITTEDFAEFFAAVHGGAHPYAWQVALVERLVTTGQWPEQIAAPTGSGKSSVVEAHVFANAMAACGAGARVPRRLAVVVNRRALVDAHADRAEQIRRLLEAAPADGTVLDRVRQALVSLRGADRPVEEALVTGTMRGALAAEHDWINAPEACAVLSMTPDMWGSSLLFRSYGAAPFARPRLAGLLALDAVVIIDEAHLSRQLLVTARRVSELVARSSQRLGVPSLQAVEMTATPSSSLRDVLAVTDAWLDADPDLAQRVCAAKSIRYDEVDSWPNNGKMSSAYRDDIVSRVVDLVHELAADGSDGPRTVGCVLNRVDSARQVSEALERHPEIQGKVELWVGRMRPWDLEQLRQTRPGLFTTAGDPDVDVIVATQTIEVGVDLDLGGLVTELASGTAIMQRAGRVNRLARRTAGPVVVVGPPRTTEILKDVAPYSAPDLMTARGWLEHFETEGTFAPLALSRRPPEPEAPRRPVWQRPEPWDAGIWAKTSMRLVSEPELDLWLRDDLEPDRGTVGLVLRDLAVLPDAGACEGFVAALPPLDREIYPLLVGDARRLLGELHGEDGHPLRRSVLWRGAEIVPEWQACVEAEKEEEVARALRPGDVIVVDPSVNARTGLIVRDESWGPVPSRDYPGLVSVETDADQLARFRGMTAEDIQEEYPDEIVLLPSTWDDVHGPAWLVRCKHQVLDENSNEFSALSRGADVLLADHARDVADRARTICNSIGLDHDCGDLVYEAALWHDRGKQDQRFQRFLGARGEQPIAKSRGRVRAIRRAWAEAGLPPGWRHELASAAAYWESDAAQSRSYEQRALVTRMIGTSHGRGRPTFALSADDAGPGWPSALVELVGEGEWESIIEHTDRGWGHWATSYLESLVRAADCTVSAEGK